MFEETDFGLSQSIQHSSGQRKPPITCFRCGMCCTWYQPKLTFREAQHIADALDLSLDVFRDRYVDEPPYGPDNLILDNRDGACVFLEHTEGNKTARCLIYSVTGHRLVENGHLVGRSRRVRRDWLSIGA